MLRVIITTPSLKGPGGVASYFNSILPYFAKNSNIIISVLEVGSYKSKSKLIHTVLDQYRFIKTIFIDKYDIVHINPSLSFKSFIRDGLFIFWAKRKKKLPVVVFFRGWNDSFYYSISGLLNFFFKITYKKADCFIVLANDFKLKLIQKGIKQPIYVLSTAVDDSLIKNFSIKSKIYYINSFNTIKILYLSRIEKQKGIFETIDACHILLNRNINLTLSIAGNGSAYNDVLEYIAYYNLQNHINILGYVKGEQKQKTFQKHDIYCFPTYYGEGMPNSVLEAMAFGMPVVTTPVGGLKDFFQDGKMGYLAHSTQPEEIASCLEKIIQDKDTLYRMAKYNYYYANKHFLASRVAKSLFNIYCDIDNQSQKN